MIEQLKFLETQIKETEFKIKNIMYSLINGATIPGEIVDIHKFSTAAKLVAFAGLDASVTQSGSHESSHNVMSKRCSPYLRKALFSAALTASFNYPAL